MDIGQLVCSVVETTLFLVLIVFNSQLSVNSQQVEIIAMAEQQSVEQLLRACVAFVAKVKESEERRDDMKVKKLI